MFNRFFIVQTKMRKFDINIYPGFVPCPITCPIKYPMTFVIGYFIMRQVWSFDEPNRPTGLSGFERISVRHLCRIARKLSKLEPKVLLRNFPSAEEIQDNPTTRPIFRNCTFGCFFIRNDRGFQGSNLVFLLIYPAIKFLHIV